jgi:hypothetical protein
MQIKRRFFRGGGGGIADYSKGRKTKMRIEKAEMFTKGGKKTGKF